MIDRGLLDGVLLVAWIILSLVLVMFASASAGRKLADIDVMRLRKVNGIRSIAAIVQLRSQVNRIALGVVFGALAVLVLADMDPMIVRYVSRVGLVLVLVMFAASSVLDWQADREQLRLQVEEYEREHK